MILRNKKRFLSLTGFTLIEVMISVLITSIVVTVVYSTYRTCVNTYEREKTRTFLYQDIKIIFEYLENDIRGAFVSPTNRKLVFIGKNMEDKGIDTDSLEITTTSSFELDKDFAKFPLRRVKYFLVNDNKSYDFGLQRVILWGNIGEEKLRATLGPLVKGIKFRYFDGAMWRDSWGVYETVEQAARHGFVLPQGVEVTLTLEDLDNPNGQLVISKFIPVMAGYPTFYR